MKQILKKTNAVASCASVTRSIAFTCRNGFCGLWTFIWFGSILFWLAAFSTESALGAGTPAGTTILNNATVAYAVGTGNFLETSNNTITIVSEVLDATLAWQDASPVSVNAGAAGQILTFRLTNTGNGNEAFRLTNQSALPGDDFDPSPAVPSIYLDSNSNDIYEPGIDPAYSPGVNDPDLPADASRTLFILNDIPAGLSNGAGGNSRLEATAVSGGSGIPGFLHANAGDGGIDAVDGSSGGTTDAVGTYVVSDVNVTLIKSATITDPQAGTQPVTGATITYTIFVTVSGSGSAQNLVISDAIPVNTTYSPATLMLDTLGLTDLADGDAGDVSNTTPGYVTVNLGTVAAGSPARAIEFKVTID